ncbi:MAG: hypothetical protein WAU39_08390 [Polyangiales bacterium]
MNRQIVLRASILLVALLGLNGCKSEETKSAKEAKSSDPVLVLDAGQEPRSVLRYDIAHGTTMNSTMEYGIVSLATTRRTAALAVTPGVRLHIVSGPTMEGKRGVTRFDVRIVKAEAIVPPGLDPELANDLNSSVSVLNNVGGWVEVDDRGIVKRAELNEAAKREDVPVRLLVMLINARTSLARVVLPAEAVGVGASWEARKDLVLYGFEINQVDTYTLQAKVGNELKLNVSIRQTAPEQSVTFEEDGMEIALKSLVMEATGEVIANLNAVEANAAAKGESGAVINVTTVEGTDVIEIDRAFQVRMTVTYDLPEDETATEEAAETQE